MMHDAQVYVTGYLAAEPRFKKVAGDISTTRLRLAYTARRLNRETGEWADGATTFVNVQCWRQLAENVNMCLRKGEPVMVMGRLHVRRYEDKEGNPRSVVEIEATTVGHDLGRGVAQFARLRRTPVATGAESTAGPPVEELDGADMDDRAAGLEAGVGVGAHGGGVVDERAVADFAREINDSLGPDALGGAGPEDGPETGGPEEDGLQAAGPEMIGQDAPMDAGV
jgi:single-strand DNA-binding protein